MTTLDQLRPGERGRVTTLASEERLAVRLLELGIFPGVEIAMVRKAPLGDPLEFELLGYHLSLRRGEAAAVHIERI
jgi:Fe2+ transport system protein FeoA